MLRLTLAAAIVGGSITIASDVHAQTRTHRTPFADLWPFSTGSYAAKNVRKATTRKGVMTVGQWCLHVKYRNNFYYFYSENYAEAWTTAGSCEVGGARINVNGMGLSWRYKGESLSSKGCSNTSQCDFSERNYGIGKTIACASARASLGTSRAFATTDIIGCP